ncbi:MAG: (2Fe-2S) ferredoxin domain-containing protein [Chloroflexi bacterium]|nr:(2Fe-2S) ferredoxin domain-containing protein [Chloroflexota bacterium]
MVTVIVCLGSSCYTRGSEQLAEALEALVVREGVQEQVDLRGALCMEHCSMGVSVQVDDRVYRQVEPQQAERFFYEAVMPRVQQAAKA